MRSREAHVSYFCLNTTAVGCGYRVLSGGRCTRCLLYAVTVMGAVLTLTSQYPSNKIDDGFALILFLTPPYYKGHHLWNLGSELSVPSALQTCAFSRCRITSNPAFGDQANLVVFKGPYARRCCVRTVDGDVVCTGEEGRNFTLPRVHSNNAFVFYQRESPLRSSIKCLQPLDDYVNYTWTYRLDSHLLDRYGSYSPIGSKRLRPSSSLDFVTVRQLRRSKNVLWYVSNCNTTVDAVTRLEYSLELQRHIDVDIFGGCAAGGRSNGCDRSNRSCNVAFRSAYRFYLAFENSHCSDYVTEKLFDALRYGNVPIVRGLSRQQYERLAPPGSFIHADDFDGPASLARHLLEVAADEAAYAHYHAWRADFLIEFDDEIDMCELCRLATTRPRKSTRVSEWWKSSTNCLAPQRTRHATSND